MLKTEEKSVNELNVIRGINQTNVGQKMAALIDSNGMRTHTHIYILMMRLK